MEMGAVGQFPHPIPAAHCGSRREMFTDYGSLVAVSVQMGSTITQKLHRYDVLHRLYASRPSLPLFPSHYVREPHSDLCMGELQRRRERTVYALSTMGYIKSLVKKDTEQQQNLKMYLFNLECGSGLAEREQGDDGSDDCQSLGYPVLPILADILHEQIGNGTDLHNVNSQYTGGCLSCVSRETPGGQEAVLVYASGDNLCTLSMSHVSCDNYEFGVHGNNIDTVMVDDKIYEVVTGQIGVECYCAVRQEKKCSIFQMDLSEFNCVEGAKPTTKFLQSYAWSDRQETPSSICLSPYLVGECAVATAYGSVFLWSSDGRFDAVCNTIKSRFSGVENWCSCHYGAHPREIVVSDRTGVSLFDIRQPAHTVGMDLFILPNRLLNPAERIMVSTQHAKNTFLHVVATDYNLMLIDERFPSSPVIHWRHTLRSPPQYIDTISGLVPATSCDQCLGDDLILLASQTSHETHCFQLTLGQPSQPPQATVTPWRVSQAEDLVHLSRVDGILTDHSLLSRLSVSLVGMCAFPHHAGNGCTIFQMTAHGDISHQTYQFGDIFASHQDMTCTAGPGSDIVLLDTVSRETCTRWLQEEEKRLHTADSDWPLHKCDASHSYQGLNNQTYPHVLCSLCMPQLSTTTTVSANGTIGESDMCHMCGNSLLFGAQFRETVHKGVIIPNMEETNMEIDTCLSTHEPSRFVDTTSQLVTKLWKEEYCVHDLLQKKDEEQVEKTQQAVVTSVTETTDGLLDTSHNVDSDDIDLLAGDDPLEHDTLSVRIEPSDCPPVSTSIMSPLTQHTVQPSHIPRRRYLSSSSVDSVVSLRSHGKPGFQSTPPRLRHSKLPATTTWHPPKSVPLEHYLPKFEQLLSPSNKKQTLESPTGSEHDASYSSEVLSFSQDHVTVMPSCATNVMVYNAPGSTSTGKKKRRKFEIGF